LGASGPGTVYPFTTGFLAGMVYLGMGTHIGQGEFIIAAFIVRGYQNRAGKGRQYDSMSYVFTGGTGTDIILNQSIVIMTLKGLVSITVFFYQCDCFSNLCQVF
jgi:hypothetical protein